MDWSQLQKIKTSSDIEKEAKRISALAYLTETDWYVIRNIETGTAIPSEVTEKRKLARLDITS